MIGDDSPRLPRSSSEGGNRSVAQDRATVAKLLPDDGDHDVNQRCLNGQHDLTLKKVTWLLEDTMYPPSRKWLMLGLGYIALLTMYLVYLGWTPALETVMGDLSISYEQAGLLASITGAAGGVALPFVGILADSKFGAKRLIAIGLAIGAVGQFLFAIGDTYSVALISRVFAGVCVAILFGGCYALALKWFEDSKRYGTAAGTLLTSDGIGTLVALYVFSFALLAFGWRGGMTLSGVLLVAALIVTILFLRDAPRASASEEAVRPARASRRSFLATIRPALTRNLWAGILFTAYAWGIFALVGSWVPTILIEAGWSPETAGLLTASLALAGILSAVAVGLLVDRVPRKKRVFITAGLAITIAISILTAAVYSGNYVLMVVMLPILGLAIYGCMPAALSLAVSSAGSAHSGIVTGLMFGAAFLFGGFLYPYVIGYAITATGGYGAGFVVTSVVTVVLCIASSVLAQDVRDVSGATEQRESSAATLAPQPEAG